MMRLSRAPLDPKDFIRVCTWECAPESLSSVMPEEKDESGVTGGAAPQTLSILHTSSHIKCYLKGGGPLIREEN